MNKKVIISIITLSLCFGLSLIKLTFAEEGIMSISETEGNPVPDDTSTEGMLDLDDINETSDDSTTIVDTEIITTDADFESDSELKNDIEHNGTSDEPLVVCADPNEPGCEDALVGPEADPEMWPLYLSLGALGVTILLVIIINLIGRQKKDHKQK